MIFKETGSYSMEIKDFIILSINSIHFSDKNNPNNDPEGPGRIFTWLNEKLEEVRRRKMKAILIYHLPHGEITIPLSSNRFWLKRFEDTYISIIKRNFDIISGIYTGHIHISGMTASPETGSLTKDLEKYITLELEQLKRASVDGWQVMNRAVSPILGNNPGFTIYYYYDSIDYPSYYEEYTFRLVSSYDRTDSPLNYWTYLYNSREDLGLQNLSPKSISEFLKSVEKDMKKFVKYMMYRMGKEPNSERLSNTIEKIRSKRKLYSTGSDKYEGCCSPLIRYVKKNNH